jgi:prevent-host-death family protein
MEVAVNQLKAGLSAWVARARQGEVIVITSHDKPVARLVAAPVHDAGGLSTLLASGAASWAGGKLVLHQPALLPPHHNTLSESVIEDRR